MKQKAIIAAFLAVTGILCVGSYRLGSTNSSASSTKPAAQATPAGVTAQEINAEKTKNSGRDPALEQQIGEAVAPIMKKLGAYQLSDEDFGYDHDSYLSYTYQPHAIDNASLAFDIFYEKEPCSESYRNSGYIEGEKLTTYVLKSNGLCYIIDGGQKQDIEAIASALKPLKVARSNGTVAPDTEAIASAHKKLKTDQPSATASNDIPEEQEIRFAGDTVSFPKGATEQQMREKYPHLNCMETKQGRLCFSKTELLNMALIQGLPNGGTCIIGKEERMQLTNGHVTSASCDLNEQSAKDLIGMLLNRYGKPTVKDDHINGMRVTTASWGAGDVDVTVTLYSGQNAYGAPINNASVLISGKKAVSE